MNLSPDLADNFAAGNVFELSSGFCKGHEESRTLEQIFERHDMLLLSICCNCCRFGLPHEDGSQWSVRGLNV